MESNDHPVPLHVYAAARTTWASYFRALWQHRSMITVLAYRDWRIKYAQTLLGVGWSALQPLATLVIFTFFFQRVVDISRNLTYPYPFFAFSGLLCWQYFSFHVNQGGISLIYATDLIKKISFPKLVIPLSKSLAGLADFGTALVLLFCLMAWYGITPGVRLFLLPLAIVLQMLLGLSVSIWLSALTVRFRDLQHILPHLINFGIWLTPVFYPGTLIPGRYAFILHLNPVAGVIQFFRWCLVKGESFDANYGWGLLLLFLLLLSGLYFFRRTEDYMSDYL